MSDISKTNEQSSPEENQNNIRGFLKVLVFYALMIAFSIWLFITNDGPSGVGSTQLIMIALFM